MSSLPGCADSPPSALSAFIEVAREGDRAGVLRRLGPRTRAQLEASAHLASEQAGRRRVLPEELLAAGYSPPRWEAQRLSVVERKGDHAVVEVRGPHGERTRVEMVLELGAWKVELP